LGVVGVKPPPIPAVLRGRTTSPRGGISIKTPLKFAKKIKSYIIECTLYITKTKND
jgi:hypothetical protein